MGAVAGGWGRWTACWCVVACLGCGKAVDDPARGAAGATGANNSSAGERGSGDVGSAGEAGSTELAAFIPLPPQARRLTTYEYANTVSDVLGTARPDTTGFSSSDYEGFDNASALNGVDEGQARLYLSTAEALAEAVFGSEPLRARFVICELDEPSCLRQLVEQAGLRLFRRPLLEGERASYEKGYASARSRGLARDGALKEVLTALLASLPFVYRVELAPATPGVQPVSQYELATRLSYLLWSSAPDASLLDAAANGALETDPQLEAQVERLLADEKGQRFAENFGGQWLGARRVQSVAKAASLPWSPAVARAAASEITLFFGELMAPNTPLSTLFTSPAHYVNSDLAPLYGVSVSGSAMQRQLIEGQDRRGFLGLVGALAANSLDTRTSPSFRGFWTQKVLLCADDIGPPPANEPLFSADEAGTRPYLDGLNAQDECATCHRKFDPIGLALERYDPIGRYRESYASGATIDDTVSLVDAVGGPEVASGIAGLSDALAKSPAFGPCAARRLYAYGFGRMILDSDRPNVRALADALRRGPGTLRSLILQMVQSPTFRLRNDDGGTP